MLPIFLLENVEITALARDHLIVAFLEMKIKLSRWDPLVTPFIRAEIRLLLTLLLMN